jgi:dTMP kinase
MIYNTKFISFEGIDYSGKTTQINFLKERLEELGQKVVLLREPGGTHISELIREILLDKNHHNMTSICEVLLYSAARHQLVKERVLDELRIGNFVVADRYVDSTTAYQGYGRKLPMNFINQLNQIASEGLMPGITFLLDLSLSELKNRMKLRKGSVDRLEKENIEFYRRIRKGYLEIAEHERERIKIIKANRSLEQIKSEIWEFVLLKYNL